MKNLKSLFFITAFATFSFAAHAEDLRSEGYQCDRTMFIQPNNKSDQPQGIPLDRNVYFLVEGRAESKGVITEKDTVAHLVKTSTIVNDLTTEEYYDSQTHRRIVLFRDNKNVVFIMMIIKFKTDNNDITFDYRKINDIAKNPNVDTFSSSSECKRVL